MKNIAIYTALITLLFSCSNTPEPIAEHKPAEQSIVYMTGIQIKTAGMETGYATTKSVSSILKLNGLIDVPPQNMVSISVPLGGYLKNTNLLPGMHVKRGETIAVMEDQQYIQLQQDYLTAKARLTYNESEFNRQKALNQSKAGSDKAFELADAEYKSQRVLVKALYEKLKLIGINPDELTDSNLSRSVRVTSPIDGFVSTVSVNIGKYVNPADVLFELVNPSDIHLSLTVFEKDLDKIFIGQKLWAYTNNNPDKKYPCEVILIGKDLSADRSVEVHCHFDKYDNRLIPGMYMNADAAVETTNALTVPEDALVSLNGTDYIFEAKNDSTFEMLAVKTGISENGFTQIISDSLFAKKNIVTKNAYSILMQLQNKAEE